MSNTKITTSEHGPLVIRGEFTLVDHQGKEHFLKDADRAYLCRCGHSANKPFCDGSHNDVGFRAGDLADSRENTEAQA